ncbi:MAG: hypothetical protein NTY69_09900 [Methylococcales bacterium]|nr:hypothetical protein [Methylococcales bacterium]
MLLQTPFDFSISNLTQSNITKTVDALRNGKKYDLNTSPSNQEMAFGSIYSYLKGTAEYEKWPIEESVKGSSEYKKYGYENFRSSKAKRLREARLEPAHVNFLSQAFRYRGKANYRDTIYLSYGDNRTDEIHQFITDLQSVSGAFSLMAAHYLSNRLSDEDWRAFSADANKYVKYSLHYNLH